MEITIFVAISAAVFVPLIFMGKESSAAHEKARERRMAEHRLNARLLRLNL